MGRSVEISACYIVKDEADILARSLDAIRPFVDEIVVYDTGSSDETVEIARRSGAVVVEGFWDDDFGAARNRALEHCRGRLVVSVDADEEAHGDPAAFRRTLMRSPLIDFFTAEVQSVYWDGAAPSTSAEVARVLRRANCQWRGALHEQIVGRHGQPLLRATSGLGLLHSGYSMVRFQEKDKAARNLSLAQRELELAERDGREGVDQLRVNVGRAAQAAGQSEVALSAFESVDRAGAHTVLAAATAHGAIESAYALERAEVIDTWVERLTSLGEDRNVLAVARAQAAAVRERWVEMTELLDGLEDARDLRGFHFSAASTAPLEMMARFNMGDYDGAVAVVLAHVRSGLADMTATLIVRIVRDSGHELGELVDAMPDELLLPFLGQLQGSPYSQGAAFFDAMWQRDRARQTVILAVAPMAASLDLGTVLIWSLRAREVGMVDFCPLRKVFHDEQTPVGRRVVCGAALLEIGEDVNAEFERLLGEVPDEEAHEVIEAIAQVSPSIARTLQLV